MTITRTIETLPAEAVKNLTVSHYCTKASTIDYRKKLSNSLIHANKASLFYDEKLSKENRPEPKTKDGTIIWATDNYQNFNKNYSFHKKILDLSIIKPRTQKSKLEQKKRIKEKAEVFTPSWVCNLQNNIVDDYLLGENCFNKVSEDKLSWRSSPKVNFPEDYSWIKYVLSTRVEMCCGEGPYLFSPYDASTGEDIPVYLESTGWQRIGVLDRKLRVIHENVNSIEEWDYLSEYAMSSTYGFEWQGDSLVLARLNFINTMNDYRNFFIKNKNLEKPSEEEINEKIILFSQYASWQLWQMDGLKMVIPDSCTENCTSCKKKLKIDHDGVTPVIRWGSKLRLFEDFIKLNQKL